MFKGDPIVVQGFTIPSNDPVFLAIIGVHVACALTCVIAGIVAMLAQKKAGLHPKGGSVYYYSLWIVFITATIIAFYRWKEDYHLFILGSLSFISCFVARRAYRKKWKKWSLIHITGMGFSYVFLIIAFYVDNGKFLPVWKDLDPVLYWLLPLLVGIPVIVRTLLRHPLSRGYFKKEK